ncbi:MAG: cupin domain-containing protein [Planctomycetaceae bacterium]
MAESQAGNLFADLPTALPEELIEVLAENQHVRIERIVSTGHASPEGFWYDQEKAEWVAVLRGEAKLLFEDGESVHMKPGDHVLIPARRRHRVEWTTPNEPTVWPAMELHKIKRQSVDSSLGLERYRSLVRTDRLRRRLRSLRLRHGVKKQTALASPSNRESQAREMIGTVEGFRREFSH